MAIASVVYKPTPENPHNNLIREVPKEYNQHDYLFKKLIHNFFEEFLEVFFPEVHEHIDFSFIKPMSEEVFNDLTKGSSRRADIVIETKLKEESTLVIIHVEPQSTHEPKFHERMYHYFSLLYNKYRKPILPVAIFRYDSKHAEKDQFTLEFPFFHVFTFNFLMLELRKKNWRAFIESDNPAAAALLSKMGYTDKEKVEVKMEFLKMLVRMELNPAENRFISSFFDSYLTLTNEEEEELVEKVKQLDNADEILELPNSWEKRGYRKGREEEKQEVIMNMLKKNFPIEMISEATNVAK